MRLLPVLASGVLALTLLGPVTAAADGHGPTGPSLPEQAADTADEHASEVLDEAQALFEERSPAAVRQLLADGGLDATMTLNQLLRVRDDLSSSERRQADALLARPTDGRSDPMGDGYRAREARPLCGGVICVHYVRRTRDAPPRADADRDRVPNAVEQTLRVSRYVHRTYTDSGYRRPDSDGRRGGRRGKVDIYLADTGAQGFYGYCTSDRWRGTAKNRPAYCVVDDDFSRRQFPDNSPADNRKVTLAHEYFHAVQFAYDAFEDAWFMEATATWVEDEVYDGVDDNRQYVPSGQLGAPRVPLDRFTPGGSNQYGNWIFFRYLTEQRDTVTGSLPNLVLHMWRDVSGRRGAPDMYSTEAIRATLAALGASFTGTYGDFAVANRDPDEAYEEGDAYLSKVARRAENHEMSTPLSTVTGSMSLDHLSSGAVAFVPGAGLTVPTSSLRVVVNLPASATAPDARLVVHHADGTTTKPDWDSSVNRSVTATVPFSAGAVDDVELVLVNASLDTQCWRGTDYACSGNPGHDNVRTTYEATVVQR